MKLLLARILQSDRVGRVLRGLLSSGECTFRGKSLYFGGHELVQPKVVAALWWGLYESAERRLVKRYLRADNPVVELGAGIGAISVHVAERLDAGQSLVCLEGNAGLIPVLQTNLARHARHLSASAKHCVIGDGKTAPFQIAEDHLCSRIGSGGGSPISGGRVSETQTMRLSQIVACAPFSQGYQLVADIEGAEAEVLFGDPQALDACVQLIVELHAARHDGTEYSVSDLVSRLESLGFEQVDRDGAVYVFQHSRIAR
jgi:FkbM family methyltransferase